MNGNFSVSMAVDALLGGAMIGLSAAVMLLALGRIAGVSGLTAQAVGIAGASNKRVLAIAFIVGLPLGAGITNGWFHSVEPTFPSPFILVIGGLLVGLGTRLGSGCTSGHGVCGLSRFSPRSVAATLTFMGLGFATVAVLRILGVVS